MPEVPYSPIPDVRPSGEGAPALNVRAPAAAFGTTVAQAVEGVGGQLDKVGNELFTRAMALQELENRTKADEANTNYTLALGQRHAEYSALQGQAAVQGYPQYMKDVQALRDQQGADLNPMAKRYYDSESRGQMARTIFNGAGHAATQNKVWQSNTAKATLAANADGAFNTPNDDAGFQQKWNAVEDQVRVQGSIGGWGDEQIAHEIFKERSQLLSQRIMGVSKDAPVRARQMIEENKDKLEYTDWQRVDNAVHHGLITTGARVISDNVNAGWDPRMKPAEVQRASAVQEPLTRIVKYVQQNHPELRFTIPSQGGVRTPEEQAALVRGGTSHTMNSAHLDGRGIDLAPVDENGKINFNDKQAYERLEMAMKEASEKLGVPLSDEHDKIKSWDPGHYSLPKNLDYSSVPKAPEEPLQSRVDRALSHAQQMFPNDTDFHDAVRQRVIGQFNQEKSIKRDFDFRNETSVGNAILGGEGQKVPTTVEELRTISPEVAQAYDNLGPTVKRKVLGYLTKNSKDDFTANEERFRQFTQLKGMAENDPQKFLETDVTGLELPRAWRRELLNAQLSKQKNAEQDPRVTHALSILGPMLQSAKVTKADDKDRYETFVGALQDRLKQYQDTNKRPPKMDEINEIGSRLLQEQSTHWWQSSQRMFETPVPDDEEEKIRKDPKWQELGITPTDDMIKRVWISDQYQKLYGGAAKAKPTAPTATNKPDVPISR